VTPWVACAIVGIWFAYCYMTDEDLESLMSPEEEQASRGDSDADQHISPGLRRVGRFDFVHRGSVWLGTVAQRVVQRGDFLPGIFSGNRSPGIVGPGADRHGPERGTFMGFPSLVYSHGWIVTLWIASYMMVPISGFAVVGKRVAQLSRLTGAITMPDLLRERYGSPMVGLASSVFIMFFMSFMMVASSRPAR